MSFIIDVNIFTNVCTSIIKFPCFESKETKLVIFVFHALLHVLQGAIGAQRATCIWTYIHMDGRKKKSTEIASWLKKCWSYLGKSFFYVVPTKRRFVNYTAQVCTQGSKADGHGNGVRPSIFQWHRRKFFSKMVLVFIVNH